MGIPVRHARILKSIPLRYHRKLARVELEPQFAFLRKLNLLFSSKLGVDIDTDAGMAFNSILQTTQATSRIPPLGLSNQMVLVHLLTL